MELGLAEEEIISIILSMKNTFKSIGAVVVGFLTVFILSVVTDKVLENLGYFPSVQS